MMRPSSNWRKRTDDVTVDIFGNKKRGGGGDPIRSNSGSVVSNLSTINTHKLLQQNVNQSSAITPNILSSVINSSSDIPPHLKSSIDHLYGSNTINNKKGSPLKKLANQLFRQQLDEQIAEQKKQKQVQKMQQIEEEKLTQKKVQKELEALRYKHMNEINNESNTSAGFLRGGFRNSHSQIPPSTNYIKHKLISLEQHEEIKETEEIENDSDIISSPLQQQQQQKTINTSPVHLEILEKQLLEEKMAWKQKISEQELELKKLKLQMLEQQNDQKTTLQYLLKLQTDFTEQIYNANQTNNINIRRPLTGLRPISVQSSIASIPCNNQYHPSSNITRAPPTPPTPQTPQSLLHQLQSQQHIQQQQTHRKYTNYHSQPSKLEVSPPKNMTYTPRKSNIRLPAIVNVSNSSPQKNNNIHTKYHQHLRSNINISNCNVPQQQQQQQPMPSSYFPIQSVPSNNNQNISYPPKQPHRLPSIQLGVSLPVNSKIIKPETPQQISTRNSSNHSSPTLYIEEQKQESFLLCDKDENNDDISTNKECGILLKNESSFLEISDDDDNEEESLNTQRNSKQLSSSTQFELSSRPTTAIPSNIMIESKDKRSLSPSQHSQHSNCSYSSFGGNEEKQDDPFTIHVVVGDNNNEWKQISDIDRNNVASLRDAFQELSKEEFPVYNNDIVTVCGDSDSDNDENEDEMEQIDEKIPIPSPNTSMTKEMFVVKCMESKQNDDNHENYIEYEDDFEIESEIQHQSQQQSQQQELIRNVREREVLRLPELDASINNFASKVYDVYSSFDESIMTNSVASSSDLSNRSPHKQMTCKTITE